MEPRADRDGEHRHQRGASLHFNEARSASPLKGALREEVSARTLVTTTDPPDVNGHGSCRGAHDGLFVA
jgi:hypothetical protein